MERCFYCGAETELHNGSTPVCFACDREWSDRLALAASDLTKARVGVRAALDEVERLKDFYVAMPKPSSDGNSAIMLAQRTYERADTELKRALQAYKVALGK